MVQIGCGDNVFAIVDEYATEPSIGFSLPKDTTRFTDVHDHHVNVTIPVRLLPALKDAIRYIEEELELSEKFKK